MWGQKIIHSGNAKNLLHIWHGAQSCVGTANFSAGPSVCAVIFFPFTEDLPFIFPAAGISGELLR